MMSSLPNVNQAYAMVIQDESQRGISGAVHEGVEPTTLYTTRNNIQNQFQKKGFNNQYCYYCHMKGHVRKNVIS